MENYSHTYIYSIDVYNSFKDFKNAKPSKGYTITKENEAYNVFYSEKKKGNYATIQKVRY